MKSTTSVITEDGSPLQFRSWIEPKKAFNYFSEEPTVFRILWFMFLCMLGIGEGIWRLNSKTSLMMSLVFSGSNSLIYVPNFRCGLLMLVLPLPFLPVLSVFIFFFFLCLFLFLIRVAWILRSSCLSLHGTEVVQLPYPSHNNLLEIWSQVRLIRHSWDICSICSVCNYHRSLIGCFKRKA